MNDMHFVYVMARVSDSGGLTAPVKVGVTSNPGSRLSTIQTSCPYFIEIACVFPMPDRETALTVERGFHTVLKKHAVNGEWFDFGPGRAIEFMCQNIRAMLSDQFDFGGNEMRMALDMTGVTLAQQKIEEEKYLAAWESLAA